MRCDGFEAGQSYEYDPVKDTLKCSGKLGQKVCDRKEREQFIYEVKKSIIRDREHEQQTRLQYGELELSDLLKSDDNTQSKLNTLNKAIESTEEVVQLLEQKDINYGTTLKSQFEALLLTLTRLNTFLQHCVPEELQSLDQSFLDKAQQEIILAQTEQHHKKGTDLPMSLDGAFLKCFVSFQDAAGSVSTDAIVVLLRDLLFSLSLDGWAEKLSSIMGKVNSYLGTVSVTEPCSTHVSSLIRSIQLLMYNSRVIVLEARANPGKALDKQIREVKIERRAHISEFDGQSLQGDEEISPGETRQDSKRKNHS